MEIKRYVRQDRVKNGMGPIRIMVHYNNKRLPIPTDEKVTFPEGWDDQHQVVKSRQPFAVIINQKLDNLEKVLRFVYQVSEKGRIELTNKSFKETYNRVLDGVIGKGASITDDDFTKTQIQEAYEDLLADNLRSGTESIQLQQPSFLPLMTVWIEEEKSRVVEASGRKMSPNTIKGLNSTFKRFQAFEEHRGQLITFEGMDKYFYAEFREYMLTELKQGVNNFGKHVRRLKQFLAWAQDHNEAIPINPKYVRFSAPSKYVGVEFLRLDQLEAIKNIHFKSDKVREKLYFSYSNKLSEDLDQEAFNNYIHQVELARDLFLMCCYTALRISDAQTLSKSEIRGEMIRKGNQKTAGQSYIPYFDDNIFKPVTLVQKYWSLEEQIFPPCPKINKHLKVVQKLAGVEDLVLTTKIGRKTFATLKIYQGVPKSLVMQATGHKSEATFNRYLGVDEQELLKISKEKSKVA